MPQLPTHTTPAEFYEWRENIAAWAPVLEALAAGLGGGPVRAMESGTVLVALLGQDRVLKVYPPFLQDHWAYEHAALQHIGGRLQLPTPRLLGSGEVQGWPWLLMTQLAGEPLTDRWPHMDEAQKCRLLHTLGTLAAEVHRLPVGPMAQRAPAWADFLAGQRSRCAARQQRTGLPAHLLSQLEAFLRGPLPEGPAVMLTGEYTPMNLLVQQGRLAGMFDFGDGLVGPREYDFLGPLTFLAAGHAARCQAFFEGYGVLPDATARLALMRLLLLHRYSHLQAQIAHPGWQQAPSFEALVALIWPE